MLDHVAAKLAITRPGGVTTHADLAIGHVVLGRRADAVDLDVRAIVLGALSIDDVHGRVALADGQLGGAQAVAITGARVDHAKLATELGRTLLAGDAKLDVTVSGPVAALAVRGAVVELAARSCTLDRHGRTCRRRRARAISSCSSVKGASADVVMPPGSAPAEMPAIQTVAAR